MRAIFIIDGGYPYRMARFLIKEMCKKRKMSQYRLGILLNNGPKNVARLFKPDYDPKLSMLARCAKALKCRIRDLYKE